MKMLGVALALIGTGLSTAAQASEWYMYGPNGKAPKRAAWFIDKSSVQVVGDFKRAWVQMLNETPNERLASSMRMLVEIDCTGKRDRMLSISIFSDTDKTLASSDRTGEWAYIPPDSPIDTISTVVCKEDYTDGMKATGPLDIMARAAFEVLDNNGNVKVAAKPQIKSKQHIGK